MEEDEGVQNYRYAKVSNTKAKTKKTKNMEDEEVQHYLKDDAKFKKAKTKPQRPSAPSAPGAVVTVTQLQTHTVTTKDRVKALINLQSFEGSFLLTAALASALQVPLIDLEAKLKAFTPPTGSGKLGEQDKAKLWATSLAVCMFKSKLGSERDMWELVVEKAKHWIDGLLSSVQSADVGRLRGLAREVLGA